MEKKTTMRRVPVNTTARTRKAVKRITTDTPILLEPAEFKRLVKILDTRSKISMIERRIYRVDKGPAIEFMHALEKHNEAIRRVVVKMTKEFGAVGAYSRGTGYSFQFAPGVTPSAKLWTKDRSPYAQGRTYYPRLNTPEGKSLAKRLAQVQSFRTYDEVLGVFGIRSTGMPLYFANSKTYYATAQFLPRTEVVFLIVPFMDFGEEVIDAYTTLGKANKLSAMGSHNLAVSTELLALPKMKQIKEWQFLKEIEEYNEETTAKRKRGSKPKVKAAKGGKKIPLPAAPPPLI